MPNSKRRGNKHQVEKRAVFDNSIARAVTCRIFEYALGQIIPNRSILSLAEPQSVQRGVAHHTCCALPDTCTCTYNGYGVLIALVGLSMTSPGERSRSSHDQPATVRSVEIKTRTFALMEYISPPEHHEGVLTLVFESRAR